LRIGRETRFRATCTFDSVGMDNTHSHATKDMSKVSNGIAPPSLIQ
jgi:hypothetical protein